MDVCPICTKNDLMVEGAYRGSHPTFRGMQRISCRHCGMVFASPMPSANALEQYNSNYFSTAHGDRPRTSSGVAFFSGIARLRLEYIECYLRKNSISVSRVLELGPGLGFFAHAWLEKHPATEYLACETDTSCHTPLQQLGVRLLDGFPLALDSRKFDMVVMSHVLEHVPQPTNFLAAASGVLREGGALFIEVPCRDYEHKSSDEPHLLFFDKQPMEYLLHGGGFENIVTSYYGVPIRQLQSCSTLRAMLLAFRTRLINSGLVAPFARDRQGMEGLDALECAVLAPFEAHRESSTPAWWLRGLATKRCAE
jgi:SAM-dependent methyltransferase